MRKTNKKRILSFFALGLCAAVAILLLIMGETIRTETTIGFISCESNSMYPNLYCDCITMNKAIENTSQIQVGDVITFRAQYGLKLMNVVHRVTEKDQTYVITKGDNNGYTDGFTNYNQVLSKVVWAVCPPLDGEVKS